MKIFDWQDIPMLGKNVYDVFDELFYRSEKAGMETQDDNVIMDRFYWSLVRCQTFDFEEISESWLAEQCGLRTVHYLWL